jgi:hypothetical protein
MTPFTVDSDQVDYMKFRPGVKVVLGPTISIVMTSCNVIPVSAPKVIVQKPMKHHPEVEALLYVV